MIFLIRHLFLKHAFMQILSGIMEEGSHMHVSIILKEHPTAFNPGIAGASVADKILQGVIAEEQGQLEESIELLKGAAERETNMLYAEPKDWPHPAQQYLGNELFNATLYDAADEGDDGV